MTETLRSAALRAILSGGMTLLALLAAGSAARAQFIEPAVRKDFAFRVGTYIPTDQGVRRAGGTHNLALEVDYVVQRFTEKSGVSLVSLGYIERDGFKMIPATVSYVIRETSTDLNRTYYYGIGGGLYQIRVNAPDTTGDNKWLPGGFVVVGLDLTDKVFTDLKYHYTSNYDQKFVGGTQLSLGIRF